MKKSFAYGILSAASLALQMLSTAPAHAGIDACRNIDVEANGKCDVRVDAKCDVSCTPFNVQAACAAQVDVTYSASCPKVPSVSCQADCQGECEASCEATPAQFDCAASCRANAAADCDAQCASNAKQSECTASCQATFAADCDASCHVTPGTADCSGKCQGSCSGSCTAQSELECQFEAQGQAYASCEASVQGRCEADCTKPEGALFCDGEYIDHTGTLQDCIDAIKATIPSVTIDVSAQGSASCSGNRCVAEGSASANCAFAPSGPEHEVAGVFATFVALGAICLRRRRAR
ncbi:MAG: hypothetical protein ABUL62_18415 [Myxococcales bacterium]